MRSRSLAARTPCPVAPLPLAVYAPAVAPAISPSEQQRFFDERAAGYDAILFRSRWPRNQLLKARLVGRLLGTDTLAGRVVELVPLYDLIDALASRISVVRALAIFYVACGTVPA